MNKKILYPAISLLALCLARCVGPDCGPDYQPELRSVTVNMHTVNEEGIELVASDLRLDLVLEVGQIKLSQNRGVSFSLIQRAYACSYDPPGFTAQTQIKDISLTCDKPVRGFEAGENILTTSALIAPTGYYYPEDHDLTLGRWLYAVNNGKIWNGNEFYDISIAPIPEGTVVPAGDYIFTFFMELRGGKTFTRRFEPVRISAL